MGQIKYKLFFLIILPFFIISCRGKQPVKLGIIADFSSRASQLGVQARNGVTLAVQDINDLGGVDGRLFEFVFADNRGDSETCKLEVRRMIDEGVEVIIGPMVSSMAEVVIDAAEKSGTLIISPTVSSDEFTGIDDNFIKCTAPASFHGKFLARAIPLDDTKNLVFIMDQRNQIYVDAVLSGFDKETVKYSLPIGSRFFFSGKEDFPSLLKELEEIKPDVIIFVASGMDSAGILQLYAKENQIPLLFGSAWTKLSDVIKYGGKTVEGMVLVDFYMNVNPLVREVAFYKRYREIFGVEPNAAATSAYESVKLYYEALKSTGSTNAFTVKEAIINMEEIEGISDTFFIDEYGDAVRELSNYMIKNGEYKLLPERM